MFDDFVPVEVNPNDQILLEKIGRLRVTAWAQAIPEIESRTNCFLDAHELSSRHWCVFLKGEPIAAARLSIRDNINAVPDAEVYRNVLPVNLPFPIASLSRLVTHPDFRGRGISRLLDEVRVDEATKLGCKCIIGATPSGPDRLAALLNLGFSPIGPPVANSPDGFLRGTITQVLLRLSN